MRTARIRLLLLGVAALLLSGVPGRAEDTNHFPLQDGDTWVMGGDSITAQHLHSNYFEAFCYARYPNLKFRFRNSGVGGDTIPKLMARFDWDVAAWKPTIVSVELGMNDQGGYSVEQYVANMGKLTQQIQTIKARPVFFTASPINNGATMANLDGNAKLNAYAVALKKFAEEQKAPFADQFHALLDPWGKNKPHENLANALDVVKAFAQDDKLAGVEHLRAFFEEQARSPHAPVAMKGDAVHPGPPGQLMMAAALLKDLDAMGFVSNAVLDDTGKVLAAKGCQVSDVKATDGKLTFDRLDECLPFPIPDDARAVLPLYSTILDLSQYGLQVKGLKGGKFVLKVNGVVLGNGTIEDLEKGVNLTVYGKGPLADQGKAILNAVAAKEGLVGQWRGLSRIASVPGASADTRERLVELTKKVEDADAKIRAAAKPRKLHFEVTAVTDVGK